MKILQKIGLWCFALCAGYAGFAGYATAQWKDWDYDLEQEKKSWTELQARLPGYPKPENLRRIDMGAATANSYFVDAASVSVGEDGVVRYTLLIRAGGGATNVSFEGIRCENRQVRLYAFGRQGAEWSRARNSEWRAIEARNVNGHHYTLAKDYFCSYGWTSTPHPLRQIQSTLRTGPVRDNSPP